MAAVRKDIRPEETFTLISPTLNKHNQCSPQRQGRTTAISAAPEGTDLSFLRAAFTREPLACCAATLKRLAGMAMAGACWGRGCRGQCYKEATGFEPEGFDVRSHSSVHVL